MPPAVPRSWLTPTGEARSELDVIRVGGEAWINLNDLVKYIKRRKNRVKDHGYLCALTTFETELTDLLEINSE